MKESGYFPGFDGWQEGYGGFTKSHEDKDKIIAYIINQEEHHKKESFLNELKRLVEEAGLKWDDRYLP